jgi:hypothetical protein
MSDEAFEMMRLACPESKVSSFKATKSHAAFLSGVKPVLYDCCIGSCCCFVGALANSHHCPYCNEARYSANGKTRKHFVYIPLIPRLIHWYTNKSFSEQLRYRSEFQHEEGTIKDVMDSDIYIRLRNSNVIIDGDKQQYKYFDDPRDLMLGLATDGFCPFKRRKQTCWPLLLYNYNLPPEVRFWLQYIICLGVIPGPHKPKDFDSFFWPAIQELLKLACGVKAFDAYTAEFFKL